MMKEPMVHYEFKEEARGELLTPWGDPMLYESAFDYHFLTEKEAWEMKNEYAPDEEWLLLKVTTEIVSSEGGEKQ